MRQVFQFGISRGQVVLISRHQPNLAVFDESDRAVAVPFDFKEPVGAIKGFCDRRRPAWDGRQGMGRLTGPADGTRTQRTDFFTGWFDCGILRQLPELQFALSGLSAGFLRFLFSFSLFAAARRSFVDFFFFSSLAMASASHAALTLPRPAGGLLVHSFDFASPPISFMVRLVSTEVSNLSMSYPFDLRGRRAS